MPHISSSLQVSVADLIFPAAYFVTGCYFSIEDYGQTQHLFNTIPTLLERKKLNGKDLPTEVFVKKKRELFNTFVDSLAYNGNSGLL